MDQRGRLVFLALGLVIGATAGAGAAVVARMSAAESAPSTVGTTAASPDVRPQAPEASPLATPSSDRVPAQRDAPAAPATDEQLLFGPVQRAYGEAGLKTGWASLRPDEMPPGDLATGMARYEALVRNTPASIGRELASARTNSEQALADSKAGGVMALLGALVKGGVAPPVDAVRNRARFDSFFPRQTLEGFVDGPAQKNHPGKTLTDGSTLSYPAGVFLVSNLMQEKNPFPNDVTVSGAGMDSTMLVMSGALFTRESLNRFTIRDCTVFTNNNYLFDLRVKPASITFLRARFIGFDMGAGASVLLASNQGAALRADSCRFEGGYGRNPAYGQLLDVRTDALLARFEGCRFAELSLGIERWRQGAAVVFVGCTFEDMLDRDDLTSRAGTNPGVLFDGCSFAYLVDPDRTNPPKKDLNALFPDWNARMNQ